ncbi:hypothetical protein [Parasitella parasitica]|uniref:F-box domain-containing protein n=1 Tax=Parasitella parasitica TaxID=35722 RepID=A0A0B7NJ47_9FUNG|nr:hypothetical protein [Parasitella parasitica]
MTLPKTPIIKIPLNHRDTNQILPHFHRRPDSKDLLEKRRKRQTKGQSSALSFVRNDFLGIRVVFLLTGGFPKKSSSPSSFSQKDSPHNENNDTRSRQRLKSIKQPSKLRRRKERVDLEQEPKKIEPMQKHRTHEPRLLHALPRSFTNYRGQEMFITTDTPIFGLPLEIMLQILQYCSSYEDYLEIFFVCKRWRRFMDSAHLWEDVSIQWNNLKTVITLKCPLPCSDHITDLTIVGTNKEALTHSEIDRIDYKPFPQLRNVRTIAMNMADVKFIIGWMRNIESLDCKDTHCLAIDGVNLSRLSELQQLKSLQLGFAETLNLSYNFMRFDLSGNSSKRSILPRTLETFSLHNIYDREQFLMKRITGNCRRDADWNRSAASRWMGLEDALVQKYSMLASLQNLRSLTLGRVGAFTSRVWRECLIPCGSQLEYLSLTGRPEANRQEPPRDHQAAADASARISMGDDCEAAIAEYFSCLTRIKQVYLDNFHCGVGLINGISRLEKTLYIESEGSANAHYSIDDFQDICLFNFRIKMKE